MNKQTQRLLAERALQIEGLEAEIRLMKSARDRSPLGRIDDPAIRSSLASIVADVGHLLDLVDGVSANPDSSGTGKPGSKPPPGSESAWVHAAIRQLARRRLPDLASWLQAKLGTPREERSSIDEFGRCVECDRPFKVSVSHAGKRQIVQPTATEQAVVMNALVVDRSGIQAAQLVRNVDWPSHDLRRPAGPLMRSWLEWLKREGLVEAELVAGVVVWRPGAEL